MYTSTNTYSPDQPTSNQDAFDKVLAFMREQKIAAYDTEMSTCRYRTSIGLKCAVGCLFPDSLYHYKMDIQTSQELGCWIGIAILLNYPTLADWFANCDTELLKDLQSIHDRYMPRLTKEGELPNMQIWERKMQELAGQYNLKYTPPEGAPDDYC